MPRNPGVRGSLLPVALALALALSSGAQPLPAAGAVPGAPGAAARDTTPAERSPGSSAAAAPVPAAGSAGAAPTGPSGTAVRLGQALSGKLEDGDPTTSDGTAYDDWTYQGQAGERLTVTLRSGTLDTYLRFGRMVNGEFRQIEADDDGAGGTDSRLDVVLRTAGTYVIRANTLFAGFGDYVLEVRKR
ncbi:MAG: hypothetical protein AB1941_12610 [Gemmatimonadota bacterium]